MALAWQIPADICVESPEPFPALSFYPGTSPLYGKVTGEVVRSAYEGPKIGIPGDARLTEPDRSERPLPLSFIWRLRSHFMDRRPATLCLYGRQIACAHL